RATNYGTWRYVLSHAIDMVPVDERGLNAPYRLGSLLRPESPEAFPGFGRELRSPVDGEVHSVHDGEEDHDAHRGLPSIGYALTQGRRAAEGWTALAGNHVIVRSGHGGGAVFVALCHLRRGSIAVRPGQAVRIGDRLADCRNSGNSTEPHLHLQAMSAPDPTSARAVPFTFPGRLPPGARIGDGRW